MAAAGAPQTIGLITPLEIIVNIKRPASPFQGWILNLILPRAYALGSAAPRFQRSSINKTKIHCRVFVSLRPCVNNAIADTGGELAYDVPKKEGIAMSVHIKKITSRREFVKEVAGAAVVGSIACLQVSGAEMPENPDSNENLVAPCGLYCGACPMYLATQEKDEQKIKDLVQRFSSRGSKVTLTDLQCDGCIAGGRIATFCRRCEMRECAGKKQDVTRCSDCQEFPCSLITNFNNDGMLHHAEVLENCRSLREVGIKEWAKHEAERWSCPQCRGKISWYDTACSRCGAKRSGQLFALEQG